VNVDNVSSFQGDNNIFIGEEFFDERSNIFSENDARQLK